ncbi:helix-turn-helix domain-containing protein [Streptosporangium sp. NPDC001559]|uniref:helix-turn-helix domain-containing protein n=1 Tax=Streptosporangium sp. NPDC001559 TaxID=3366187 RepID=UPI0036E148E2
MSAESQEWHEFGRALRKSRKGHQITQRQLGELIGWADSMVSRWESGTLTPSAEAIEALDSALTAEGKLISLGLHAAMADGNRLRKGTVEAKASTRDEDDSMERRRLMRDAAVVAVGSAVAPALTALTDAWQVSQPPISGSSVSQAMIDDWEHAADIHEQRARFDPPAVILAALAVDYTSMAPHLGRAQSDAVQRDLAHAAARHAALIGGKWFDLGNHREAHRWWAQARLLSEQSGDSLLTSWLRGWEAGYRRQAPDEDLNAVLLVTREARRFAGDSPSASLVAALSEEAKVLAMIGRHAEATTTLRRTEETYERLPSAGSSRQGRALWYDRTLIYTFAGDVKRAEDARATAEKLYPAGHRSAILLALHGAALHARTDPAESARQALQLLEALPAERRDTRVMSASRMVVSALPDKAHGLSAAQELCALIGHRSA